MLCYEINIYANGKIEYLPKIQLSTYGRTGISIGGGRRLPSTFISLSLNVERRLMIREPFTEIDQDGVEKRREKRYLTQGTLIISKGGKPLIVEPWTKSLLNDQILVLCHIESGLKGKAFINPSDGIKTWASGERWRKPEHLNYASFGIFSERLAVMEPGQYLTWNRTGRGIKTAEGKIIYLGRNRHEPFMFMPLQNLQATG